MLVCNATWAGEWRKVRWVDDGDTVVLSDGVNPRLGFDQAFPLSCPDGYDSITVLPITLKGGGMNTATSRLTKKYQATVPEPIRKVLRLKAGDIIAFDVEGSEVKLRKARRVDLEFAAALNPTLNEWMSQNDEEAYGDL